MPKKDGGWLLPEVLNPPMRCVSFEIPDDQNHMMAFWGALNELTYWFNWQRDDAHTAREVSYKWQLLIQAAHDRFLSENPCGNEITEDCVELAPHHPAVEWQPMNPFLDPSNIPSGYLLAPFSVVNLDTIGPIDPAYLVGLENGDVITTLLSIPGNPIEVLINGLPRFLIRVNGIGTVNLNLINLPFGGFAAIGKDTYVDIPGLIGGVIGAGVIIVDLNRDIISIPPETSTLVGQSIEFTEGGPHFIEVAFIPNINDSGTPVTFGGGLRNFMLCGFEPVEGNNVIRVIDCKLEQSADGVTWTEVYDLTTCLPEGIDGADGASVEMRVEGAYIQWRQSDDDPTWTNLIALSAITGAPGTPGTNGIDGASPEMRVSGGYIQWRQSDDDPTWTNLIAVADLKGDQGIPGTPGKDGTAGGNTYPPAPIVGDEVCNAAAYIADRVRDLIVDVYAQIATLEPGEVLSSLLNMGGWSTAALYDLITTGQESLASETAVLAAYDASKSSLINELKTHALDQTYISSWLDVHFASDPVVRDMTKFSVQSAATDGRYGLWIAVGQITPNEECEDIPTPPECIEFVYDTSTGNARGVEVGRYVSEGDLIEVTVTGSYVPAPGYPSYNANGHVGATGALWLDPDHNYYSVMMQVQGEGIRTWHFIGTSGSFTAPLGGELKVVTNQFTGDGLAPLEYADNVGSFTLDICVTTGAAELIEYDKCIKTGPGEYDLISIINTDYQSGGASAVDNVPFKITAYEWEDGTPTTGYVTINGANFQPDEIPLDVATTQIILYLTGVNTLHVSIVRA
jgi:hypothetical protein